MQGFLIFQKVCTDILTHSLLVFHFKCKYGNDRKIMLHDEGVCICPMEVTLRREKGGDLKAVLTDISIRQPDPCQSNYRNMPRQSITCNSIDNKQTLLSLRVLFFTLPSLPCLYPPDSNGLHKALPFYKTDNSDKPESQSIGKNQLWKVREIHPN